MTAGALLLVPRLRFAAHAARAIGNENCRGQRSLSRRSNSRHKTRTTKPVLTNGREIGIECAYLGCCGGLVFQHSQKIRSGGERGCGFTLLTGGEHI